MKIQSQMIRFFVLMIFFVSFFASQEVTAQRKKKTKSTEEQPTDETASEEDTGKKTKKTKKTKTTSTKLSKDEKKAKAEEEKKLKAELKNFNKNLDSYRRFKEEKARAEGEAKRINDDLTKCKELETNCGKEVELLRTEIDGLNAKLKGMNNTPAKGFGIPKEGTFYVVQIGAFKEKDPPTNDDNPDFRKDNAEGYNKYIMGVFETVEQADQLKAFLQQIDFKRNPAYRPFIVPYKDGGRISLEDALGPEEAAKRKGKIGQ